MDLITSSFNPFCAETTYPSRLRCGASARVASAVSCAFTARTTCSNSPMRSSGTKAGARATNWASGPSMRSPAPLIATTWSGTRSTNVTSCPARARCAPMVPPIAPAPHIRSFMESASPTLGEPVADQAERDPHDQEGEARKCRHPPRQQKVLTALGDHRAPLGRWPLRAEAEEAQRRAREDRQHHAGEHVDERRRDHVRQDVAKHNASRRAADRPRSEDILQVA